MPADAVTIIAGEELLSDYLFNKHTITHRFCPTCGCQPFGMGAGPDGSAMAAVNLRCVPSIDLDALSVEQIDGASF